MYVFCGISINIASLCVYNWFVLLNSKGGIIFLKVSLHKFILLHIQQLAMIVSKIAAIIFGCNIILSHKIRISFRFPNVWCTKRNISDLHRTPTVNSIKIWIYTFSAEHTDTLIWGRSTDSYINMLLTLCFLRWLHWCS